MTAVLDKMMSECLNALRDILRIPLKNLVDAFGAAPLDFSAIDACGLRMMLAELE
jgi:hypothetical protein